MRFGILGISVTVQPWFWLTAALLSGVIGSPHPDAVFFLLAWLVVVFVSVLWHELGHALLFRRFGSPSEIVLQAFGGCTVPQRSRRFTSREELMISAAGPAFGLGLWLVVFGLLKTGLLPGAGLQAWGVIVPGKSLPDVARWILLDLQMVNLWWSLINLLPVGSLDGGHILAAALGRSRAREAAIAGVGCGGVVTFLAFAAGQLFLALLIGLMTYESFRKLQAAGGGPRGGRT